MIPSIERILFATDLSQNSVYAMHHLVGLAKATGAKVRVLNVLPANVRRFETDADGVCSE